MPKIVRSRKPGHSRISGKRLGGKYSIKAKAPMKAIKLTMPGKVAQAKLDYDIAVEETLQASIVRDLQAIDQQMVNERNRYQVVNKKFVRGESQLIGDSQNYSMLKRQKETLQREQQRSTDRISTMKTNKIVSVSPVKSASKAFRGISNFNPMQSGKSYVPVIPSSSVASPGPLGNMSTSFLNVLGAAKNLVPSLPKAYGANPVSFATLLKGGKIAGKTFTESRKRGKEWMEGPNGHVVLAEREKAQKEAMKNATPAEVTAMLKKIKNKFKGKDKVGITRKEAKEWIGLDAAKKAEKKTLALLGEEEAHASYKPGQFDADKIIPTSKTAFFDPDTKAGKVGDLIAPMTPAEAAAHERQIAEDLAGRQIRTDVAGYEGVPVEAMREFLGKRPPKKIGRSGAQGFSVAGDFSRNVSSVEWFDETTAKKMIAAGTVLGSGTFLPLHAAYGDHAPPKAKGFDPVGGVIEFGGDFYKGVQGMFGPKSKKVFKKKPSKKKGKKR